jgi:hypothetical protein
MPNGHGKRQEDEEELIEAVESEGWDYYPNPDAWITEAAQSDELHFGAGFSGPQNVYHGDNYVYMVVSSVHGTDIHVFSKRKSEYFETTPEEGTCPNCEEYVRRYEEDDHLTCHRCGWQYKPLKERLSNLFG